MACSGRFADATDYDEILGTDLDLTDLTTLTKIERALDFAAGDIHAAMASSGQCDCSLAGWATNYLKKLNVLDAAVIYRSPCGDVLTDDDRKNLSYWINDQLELIRTGKIELCDGYTGKDHPAFASAMQALTSWNIAEIIMRRKI